MNTDRLRQLRLIVDSGSLSKAAAILGISHSGLSRSMSALAAELGYEIFRAEGRGLALTAQGRELYRRAEAVLRLVHELGRDPGETGAQAGPETFRLGLPEALALTLPAGLATELGGGLLVEELDSGEIEAALLRGRLDAGLTFVPFPRTELEHLKLARASLRSYARRGAFAGMDPATVPYVVPSEELRENPLSIRIRDGWNPRLPRHAPYRANTLAVALGLVQSGRCAVFAPCLVAAHWNSTHQAREQLAELALDPKRREAEEGRRDIFLVKPRATPEGPALKRLARAVRRLCRAG